MDELARMQVRLDANNERLNRGMRESRRIVDREATGIETRVRAMDSRISRAFRRSGTNAIQQAGFQVGDFAVQVASGQSAMRAFIQQGTQFVQIFGPVGSVIGAAGAVIGALVVGLGSASEETEEFAGSLDDIDVGVAGLERAARAYADAISNTSSTQTAASANIVAQTEREFKAKQQLLELELKRIRASQAERQARIGTLETEAAGPVLRSTENLSGRNRRGAVLANQNALAQFEERLPGIQDELKLISAEGELVAVQIERIEEALSLSFEDLAARGESGGRRGRSGSSRPRNDVISESVGQLRERLELLQEERAGLGLNEAELVRYTAANERARIVSELENKARQEGIALTPAQREQIDTLATSYEVLSVAIFDGRQELEKRKEEEEKAIKRQEDLAAAIAKTGEDFIRSAQRADSFRDALKNIGLELLNLVGQGVLGQGVLGGAFNSVLGVESGGISGLFANAKGNVFAGGNVVPFARGGVVTGPTAFPMRGATGLMGEAGPEAIVPLRRASGGNLGVGALPANVTINVENRAGVEVRAQASQTGGNTDILLIIDQATAGNITRPGSATYRALRGAGLSANPARR